MKFLPSWLTQLLEIYKEFLKKFSTNIIKEPSEILSNYHMPTRSVFVVQTSLHETSDVLFDFYSFSSFQTDIDGELLRFFIHDCIFDDFIPEWHDRLSYRYLVLLSRFSSFLYTDDHDTCEIRRCLVNQ